MSQLVPGPAIIRGLYYPPLKITVTGSDSVIFPAGCGLRAQIRSDLASPEILAELTTENGGITRVSDDTIQIEIMPETTGKARAGSVVLDFVRTDTNPDLYLYVQMTIPVVQPVTRDTQE